VATLAEMYVQGVSTRKVKAITEELCGHAFSASSISAINQRLDESLRAFAERPSASPFLTSSSMRVMRRFAKAASS
jgi:transposase-like protein